ncbi:MAG: capsule assembly Wzi family protein [Melioribacteraceae bacterium]
MKSKVVLTLILILIQIPSLGQAVFEPVKPHGVYEYLERMSLKGVIISNEFQKQLTRKEIGEYLKGIEGLMNEGLKNEGLKNERQGAEGSWQRAVSSQQSAVSSRQSAVGSQLSLTTLEKEELEWYKKEYYDEMNRGNENYVSDLQDGVLNRSNERRMRPFYYHDSLFTFSFSPSFLITMGSIAKESYYKRAWGFKMYGEIDQHFGFSLRFEENLEEGKTVDITKQFTPETGSVLSQNKNNSIEFSETTGSILYGNSWITTGLTKEFFTLGSGYRSQLVLSTKAPSFPSIYFRLTPAKWFTYYFMHGWLLSRVTDSLATYRTELNGNPRTFEREKYFVMHALQIKPIENLSVTVGETIIYSDKSPYMGYFIPFLFYRSVDHAITFGGAESGNNGSIFMDWNYYHPLGFKLYGSAFLDEFSLTRFLKGESDRNQFGYTVGTAVYDFGVHGLMTRLEYTRILPWVYSNWIPTQTYTNANYLLGHFIGQNADQIFLQFDYRFIRGLETKVWGEYIRRGGMSAIANQYEDPGEAFLYGLRRNETNIGFEVSYEYLHDLLGKVYYQYSNVTDEDKTRTPSWEIGANHSFGVSLLYGL